jgi:imidazolonepropionase-like amidohydrolase
MYAADHRPNEGANEDASEPVLLHADAGWFGGEALARPVQVLRTADRLVWQPDPASIPAGTRRRRVDGVLLPGFVDHHVHAELVDLGGLPEHGVCEVRDLGASPEWIFPLVAATPRPIGFPRVSSTGPFLTAPGGYPQGRAWARAGMSRVLRTPAEAREAVRELVACGANAVKVALNAEAGPTLSEPVLAAVVAAAAEVGRPVIAHAEGAGQPERALAAGVAALAHVPFTHRLDQASILAFAARTRWISTLDIHGWGAETRARRIALDNLRRFQAAGGEVRYGTDLGNGPLPLGLNQRELAALAEAGLSPVQILRCLARSGHDVVATAGDPLRDQAALSSARLVR